MRSIHIGTPREARTRRGAVLTSIFKDPIDSEVVVGRRNIEGDRQADLRVHGGADKAVYAYPYEHYAFWKAETGRDDLAPGQFGENLTTEGLLEADVIIGQRFRIGTAVLEVSQPRIPCYKLGIRMGDSKFPKRFFQANRTGFYFRVVETGRFSPGASIETLSVPTESLSVAEAFAVATDASAADEHRRNLLDNPYLASAWKEIARDFGSA